MATIKNVDQKGDITMPDGKVLYKIQLTLEDGVTGETLAASADKYKAGDSIEYTSEETKYGTKIKVKPKFGKTFTPKDFTAEAKAQAPNQSLLIAVEYMKSQDLKIKSEDFFRLADKVHAFILERL